MSETQDLTVIYQRAQLTMTGGIQTTYRMFPDGPGLCWQEPFYVMLPSALSGRPRGELVPVFGESASLQGDERVRWDATLQTNYIRLPKQHILIGQWDRGEGRSRFQVIDSESWLLSPEIDWFMIAAAIASSSAFGTAVKLGTGEALPLTT
jgi:hypothetical protein